jgi:hypothetical protein
MDSLQYMNHKDITTIILSIAKIMNNVKEAKQRRKVNSIHHAFGTLLLDQDSFPMEDVFEFCAMAADRILPRYDSRHISNLGYAYALVGYDPQLDSRTLLQNIGDTSIGFIQEFNAQGISNIVWAFATLNVEHPILFKTVGDHLSGLRDFEPFRPQALSNIAWAFATSGIVHHALFEKNGSHIHHSGSLESFTPQVLLNIVWAFAAAGVQHPALFKKVGDHIASDNLKWYTPQDFSNAVWAYATAGVQHPALFDKVGDHINQLDNLKSFTQQAFANIVWAFATANQLRSDLFEKIGIAVSNEADFTSFNDQTLSNIAWAYTVANADLPMIFNDSFSRALLKRVREFTVAERRQLYQWHLWQTKELSHAGLPKDARFATVDATVSRLATAGVHTLQCSRKLMIT